MQGSAYVDGTSNSRWRLRGWIFVGCFIFIGVCWNIWLPSAGKGGLLLAVGATLMPLFWEKATVFGKMFWIVMLFVLLAVEYRAIDKEHRDGEVAQRKALATMAEGFQSVIKTDQDDFKEALRTETGRSTRESQQFSKLLERQQKAFDRQEQLAKSLRGRLLPGNEPVTRMCGRIPIGAVVLLYGTDGSLIRNFPHLVLVSEQFGPVISLNRSADGSITVFLDIRDSDRKIIARLDQDGFVVNRNNFLEMRRDKSHLEVLDEYGDDVLSVDYMNLKNIRLNATIKLPKRPPFRLGYGSMRQICTDTNGRAAFDDLMP